MRPHEKLEAWTKSIDLVIEIYRATEKFPREERYGLTSQLRRAAVSAPANIAEGAGRYSGKEFAHFVSNAQGSASELETELIIADRLGYQRNTVLSVNCELGQNRPAHNWTIQTYSHPLNHLSH